MPASGAVLVAADAVCALAVPSSWRTGAGCCRGRLTVFADHAPQPPPPPPGVGGGAPALYWAPLDKRTPSSVAPPTLSRVVLPYRRVRVPALAVGAGAAGPLHQPGPPGGWTATDGG